MLRLTLIEVFIAAISHTPPTAGFQLDSSEQIMWARNCDFPDNDYRSLSGISELCVGVCVSDATCTHWTWSRYNGGTCWLKTGTPSTKTTSYGANCGYVVSRTVIPATTSGLSTAAMAEIQRALLHSQDQARHCYTTHTGTAIAKLGDRIKAQGYSYSTAAENVAAGQTTVESVMTSWWNSPGHRANILNEGVENVGFALATNEACGLYKTYWTQDFGQSE
ncbi:hypothetical protein PC129_g2292 [Phytophthora cactorum]|uniref:SCP domain-containing protein n=1 Tax=Phytophthora cactorum TaxID=29920 RepID=A0A8T1A060_9STRA|nr:hypothetical protein PC112_g76 [Phytophthora cactorum]KAG2869313.1 hypothetical protein PC113_g328 [Phytophthora cactorum]KAG2936359.1 hypothetical protein PC114_g242 [Phytophthora cactorum]KAG2953961.1 hypothetical protein PC117_g1605 [Phytophthora cactorum]KAG3036393.1 hypothetical protein PC120_g184 [Phytophthora cactorum]